jgi:large subunit ribosomal protein L22
MEVKASLKHLKIAPRKTRLVAGLVRGMEVNKAINQLKFLNKKSAQPVLKLVNSAIASAVNNYDLDKNNLIIKEIRIEDGKTLKRWLPRAHGRATTIRKRMSHVYITLSEIVDGGKRKAKEQKIEVPVKLDDLAKQAKKDKTEKVSKTKKTTDKKITEKDDDIETHIGEKTKGPKAEVKTAGNQSFAKKMFRRKAG